MISIIFFILLVIIVIFLSVQDNNKFNTWLSPFTLFSVPYIVIILYQYLITNLYGWTEISSIFLLYIIIALVTFFLMGRLTIILLQTPNKKPLMNANNTIAQRSKFFEVISLICSVYLILYFIITAANLGTIGMVVQPNFQEKYVSGINFYIRLISMIGTVYFFGFLSKYNKKFLIFGLLCLIPVSLTFVKGIIFILILASFIFNFILNSRKVKFTNIFMGILTGILIFYTVYLIEIGIWDFNNLMKIEVYKEILAKLNVYVLSGVQSFNTNVVNPQYAFNIADNPVYAPLYNFLSKFNITSRVETVNSIWTNIGYVPGIGNYNVNTNTYVGTLLLYCGPIMSLIMNSIVAFIAYFFFYKIQNNKRTFFLIGYSFIGAALSLGWFEYYFMHTFWIYLLLLIVIFQFINLIKIKKSNYQN